MGLGRLEGNVRPSLIIIDIWDINGYDLRVEMKKSVNDREILDSFRAGLVVVDRHGNILYINDIGRRILAISSERESISPGNPFFNILLSSFESEYLPSRIEVELEWKGREDRMVIGITLSDIRKKGERVAIVAFFKDLSRIEKFSQAEGLKSRLVLLGQMAAGIAHEIRNPLASVKLGTEIIRKRDTEGSLDSLTESMMKDIKKVEDIVSQSLSFVKHEEVLKKTFNLEDLLGEIVDGVKSTYPGVEFQVTLEEDKGQIKVDVDKKLFTQAIGNILQNAAQSYGEGKGKVSISIRKSEEYSHILRLSGPADLKKELGEGYVREFINITVKDFGHGIDDDAKAKIFTPFFTTKRKGTGIGLSISQKIIHSHEGIIDVVSELGKGTEFRIKVPVS